MAIFKCKMCGGALEINSNESVVQCEYCGTPQTLPKLDDERKANLYDRANHFRRNNEFDKAMGIYEQILNEDNTDAEAYWSLVLCRYGIEYVEDPATHKRVPTVNRAQFTSIFDDDNYKSALQYADLSQKVIYEKEAQAINEIQKGILAISQKEEPFDVFICYKETDNHGRRTPDSVLANDLYYQLTQEGFKVFFSRITLEDKLGSAYEPYIFAALNSAKVMVVLGTKPEYFKAVWVKNEWSRYLALIKQGQNKMLIPAYKDMDPYDLPEEFSHLQAQDMSKLGFMQDLIRGIKKIVHVEEVKTPAYQETMFSMGEVNITPLLKRAFIFLEDGDWQSADEYCEKVLDVDPENEDAYLGKLMAEFRAYTKEDLRNSANSFEENGNYLKILRFGGEEIKEELKDFLIAIKERKEAERIERTYQNACNLMSKNVPNMYLKAAELFQSISDYKDSESKVEECETLRKDIIFDEARNLMKISLYEEAIEKFRKISDWRNSGEMIVQCECRIKEMKKEMEKARIEAIQRAEEDKIERERAKKELKKKIIFAVSSGVAIVLAIIIIVWGVDFLKDKPLIDGLRSETIDAAEIKEKYPDLQYDKNALKVFEKELERCHKNNDVKKALDILNVLAECGVYFTDSLYDSEGDTSREFSPYITGWDSFIDWMYAEIASKGKQIATENEKVVIADGYDISEGIAEIYEIDGYKVAVWISKYSETQDPSFLVLYTSSQGWYKIDGYNKYHRSGTNISYHRRHGGVMVD